MPLKFCSNLSFMFHESASILERYALAAASGFKGVECAFPSPHSLEDVVKAKKDANVQQVLLNTYLFDVSADRGYAALPGMGTQFADSLQMTVKYAKALDCKLIHIMAGIVPSPTDSHHSVFENNLKYAAAVLQSEGVTGVIEPINLYSVPNYYLHDYNRALDVLKKVNSPNIKLQLDIFHLQTIRGNITRTIKECLPYVGHIQVAQAPNRNEPNTPGEINYKYILNLLDELKYDGWIGLEYTPLSKTKDGLSWIQDYGYTL